MCQVELLWDACVAHALSATERELMYAWLKEACARRKATIMEDAVSAHLFRKKMSGASAEWFGQITVEGFSCFTRYFILANENGGALVRVGGEGGAGSGGGGEFAFQLLKLPHTLEGIECLWNILLCTEYEAVERDCIGLLNTVHESLCPDLTATIGDIRQQYIGTCMGHMRRLLQMPDTRAVRRCVALLEKLTGATEANGTCGLRSHRGRLKARQMTLKCINSVPQSQQAQKFERMVRGNINVWGLRVVAGAAVAVHPEQVRLFWKGREIPYTRNAETLTELGLQSLDVLNISMRPPPPKPKARLLDDNGAMMPEYCDIVAEWFARFSTQGRMTRQDCAAFIRTCRGDTCQWDDARVQAIYKQFDTDHDDLLLESDFLKIYKEKAQNPRGQHVVWENIESQGWGHDLKRKSLAYVPDSAAEEQQRKLLPRYIMSLSEEYFDLLFQMLELGGDTMQRVWSLLMRLPTDPRVLEAIEGLEAIKGGDSGGWNGWERLFDPTSTFRLLYALQIAGAFIETGEEVQQPVTTVDGETPPAAESDESSTRAMWRQRFLSKGGFKHMHSLLMCRDGSQLASSLHKECVASLLNIVRFFVLGALVSEESGKTLDGADAEPNMPIGNTQDFHKLVQTLQIDDGATQTTILRYVDLSVLQIYVVDLIVKVTSGDVTAHDARIVQSALQLWVGAVMNCKALLEGFFELANAKTIVLNMLFCEASSSVRSEFGHAIHQLAMRSKSTPPARLWFLKLLLESVPNAGSGVEGCCEEFFNLVCRLVRTTDAEQFAGAGVDLTVTITRLIEQLYAYPYTEKMHVRESEPDKLLVGIMTVLGVLLEKEPRYIAERDLRPLILALFNEGLFESPQTMNDDLDTSAPKFKSQASRNAAYRLLWTLCTDHPGNLQFLWKDGVQPVQSKFSRITGWDYNPSLGTKSETGRVGLCNLGCTCYMNSMMQQFYMVEAMRYGILSVEESEDDRQNTDDSVMVQIQKIFGFLEGTHRQDHNPAGLCRAYKDIDGNPINVNIQQDAQEFLNFLFDKLETRLKGTAQEKLLDKLFQGTTAVQMKNDSAEFFKQNTEAYTSLTVEVKNRKDLYESLDHWIAWETISDYKLESGEAVDVEKRNCLLDLPRSMIVHLKRFDFNFDTFLQEKLNTEFKFPTRLNVEPYTVEGLARREVVGDEKTAAPVGESDTGSTAKAREVELPPPTHPLECYDYELAGVVVHSGTADTGHYYSFRKDARAGDTGWLRFDDSIVSPFDPEDLPQECFGGVVEVKEVNKYGYESRMQRERVKNAYMLFYDRVWKEGENEGGDDSGGETLKEMHVRRQLPDRIRQSVWNDNKTFFFDRRVYHPDFFKFVTKILSKVQLPEVMEYNVQENGLSEHYIMCGTKFALETVARAQENSMMPALADQLCSLYEKNVPVAKAFLLHYAENMSFIVDLILRCPDSTVRECVQKLLNAILRTVAALEIDFWWERDTVQLPVKLADGSTDLQQSLRHRSTAVHFIQNLIQHFPIAEKLWTKFESYWGVLKQWCEDGEPQQLFLIQQGAIWRLVDIYLGDKSPLQYAQKRVKMGKANLRPKFAPLVSCVCKLALRARTLQPRQVDEKDGMMLLQPVLYEKALENDHVPEEVAVIGCALAVNNRDFSDMLIEQIQRGVDQKDYDDLRPYFLVLKPLLAIEDSLTNYRMMKTFGHPPSGLAHDFGLLALIEKYKNNKSVRKPV
jgi:ubiquitin carboxyl-terminal hydrolase 34